MSLLPLFPQHSSREKKIYFICFGDIINYIKERVLHMGPHKKNEFSHLKSKLLAEQLEEQLLGYIDSENIGPGGKLPNEFQLGEMFGVGRSTVREAVKSLATKGILEVRHGAGTYVLNPVTPDQDPLGLGAIEDKFSLALDLVEVRMMLEPRIAELAALNATEEDMVELDRLCWEVERLIDNGENYIKEDIALHSFIAECSKNKVVKQLIPIIDTAVMMFVNVTHMKLTRETVMTHRKVVEAILERDPTGAKAAMMMHLTFNRNEIRSIVKEQEKKSKKKT